MKSFILVLGWMVFSWPALAGIDFNQDGDVGTDSDIEDFYACVAGSCCSSCLSPDLDRDGSMGTDRDIEAFWTLLAGRPLPPPPAPPRNVARSVSQYGVTFHFDRDVPYCQFFNGDYAVQGPLQVTRITPDIVQGPPFRHGFQVNPTLETMRTQPFDSRAGGFSASTIPSFPIRIDAEASIIKKISISDTAPQCPRGAPGSRDYELWGTCIETGAVLTVLRELPSDGCQNYLRPAYVGASKPLVRLDRIDPSRLPQFPMRSELTSLRSIADMSAKFQRPFFDSYLSVDNSSQTRARHSELLADGRHDVNVGIAAYGPMVAGRFYEGMFRLMVQAPGDSLAAGSAKRHFLHLYTQAAFDLAAVYKLGRVFDSAAGHSSYALGAVTFAAAILDDASLKTKLMNRPITDFTETGYTNSLVLERPRLSPAVAPDPRDQRRVYMFGLPATQWYWAMAFLYPGTETADPYAIPSQGVAVDGNYGTSYQACCLPGLKHIGTMAHLWPEAKRLIEAGGRFPGHTGYADRWTTFGAYFVDRCAGRPADMLGTWDNYYQHVGVLFGPDAQRSGQCLAPSANNPALRASSTVPEWSYSSQTGWTSRQVSRHGWRDSENWGNAFANSVRSAYLNCFENPITAPAGSPWFSCNLR